ncbi:MAG: hypothetical protein WBN79_15015 [Gemmatimonadota bacterium]
MDDTADGGSLFQATGWAQRLLARLGRVADPRETSRWATLFALVVVLVPPFLLAVAGGTAWGSRVDIPFLHDVDTLARLGVVVPILVLASRSIGVQLGVALKYLDETSLVPPADEAEYQDARQDLGRRVSSRTVAVIALVLAILGSGLLFVEASNAGSTVGSDWIVDPSGGLTLAGWWYALVSRPAISFLLLLWAWRYIAWCLFLRRLAHTELRIFPVHPDRAGGLIPLVQAHVSFVLLGIALNTALSGSLANELLHQGMTVAEARPDVVFFTLLSIFLLFAPLTVFVRGLLKAKLGGLVEYGRLGHDLSRDFDARWADGGEKLLDTADPSALADFGADYDIVRGLHVFPVSLHQLAVIGLLLFAPFGALVLTQISLTELVRGLISRAF